MQLATRCGVLMHVQLQRVEKINVIASITADLLWTVNFIFNVTPFCGWKTWVTKKVNLLLAECQKTGNYHCRCTGALPGSAHLMGRDRRAFPGRSRALSLEGQAALWKRRGEKGEFFPHLSGGETLTTFIVELRCSTKKLSDNQFCQWKLVHCFPNGPKHVYLISLFHPFYHFSPFNFFC